MFRVVNQGQPLLHEKKVALVNGARYEIGDSICRLLLENGVTLAGTYCKEKSRVDKLVKEYGVEKVATFQIDFLSENWESQIDSVMAETKNALDRIDILINVSGVWLVKPFPYEEGSEAEQLWKINYHAPYRFIQKTIPDMLQRGGHIINIASSAGVKGTGQESSYSASKAALISLTESVAEEFAPRGIQVNAISPGYTETSALDKYFDAPMKQLLIKHIPMARLCKPVDVANAVLGILMNDYITGVNIVLHGGKI